MGTACNYPPFQVTNFSLAFEGGLRSKDYIVEVNGTSVFGMTHDECKALIKKAGDSLHIRVERSRRKN